MKLPGYYILGMSIAEGLEDYGLNIGRSARALLGRR